MLTSENDDNSRLEKLRFQSAGIAKLCTFVAISVSITRSSPIYFSPIISPINLHLDIENNPIPTNFWLFAQNDNEVSVDGMDVHASDKP